MPHSNRGRADALEAMRRTGPREPEAAGGDRTPSSDIRAPPAAGRRRAASASVSPRPGTRPGRSARGGRRGRPDRLAGMAAPNVLWIYCDELRADALGCYGHASARVRTPRIDELAARGSLFTDCFCNSPICVASRTATLTGAPCERTGVYANEGAWPGFAMAEAPETFPEVLARHGYATASFGKSHVPRELAPWGHEDPTGGGMKEIFDLVPLDDPSRVQSGRVRSVIGGRIRPPLDHYPAEAVASRAMQWMAAQEDRPWLARVSLLQPHTPVFPPPPWERLHERDPGLDGAIPPRAGASAFERRFGEEVIAGHEMPAERVRQARVDYYGLAAWIDTQVGRLLDFLAQRDATGETIVVFESDHGAALGEGGRFAKHVFAPEVHRVPRIIAAPGLAPAGARRDDLCESLDLGPTLLSLCGVEPPASMAGRDLFRDPAPEPVVATIGHGERESLAFPNAQRGAWDADHGWPRRTCARTSRYRLDANVRIDGGPVPESLRDVFLCDRATDPRETTNRADDPALAAVRAELEAAVDARAAEAREPARLPAAPGS